MTPQKVAATTIFPEEVWAHILSFLEDFQDVTNCVQVCTVFERSLKSRRTEYLFSSIFPLVIEKLDKSSFFACRSVCQSWRLGVDTFMATSTSPVSLLTPHCRWKAFRFHRTSVLRRFLRLMYLSPKNWNPILTKIANFDGSSESREADKFWVEVINILRAYGRHLNVLDLGVPQDLTDFCKRLPIILGEVPQITELKLEFSDYLEEEDEMSDMKLNDELQQLQTLTRSRRPPPMVLEGVTTLHLPNLPEPFMNYILDTISAPEVTKLRIGDRFKPPPKAGYFLLKVLAKFSKLEELRLDLHIDTFTSLSILGGWWHLKELHIQRIELQMSGNNRISLKNAFDCFEGLGGTLQKLEVTLWGIPENEGDLYYEDDDPNYFSDLRLRIPYLSELELTIKNVRVTSIDFVLGLRDVTYLSLDVRGGISMFYEGKNEIEFENCDMDNPLRISTNLWGKLEKLKFFCLKEGETILLKDNRSAHGVREFKRESRRRRNMLRQMGFELKELE